MKLSQNYIDLSNSKQNFKKEIDTLLKHKQETQVTPPPLAKKKLIFLKKPNTPKHKKFILI